MKNLTITLALIIWAMAPAITYCNPYLAIIAKKRATAPGGYTYLLEEDFETNPGYDFSSWGESGTPDSDYATSLEGSYSLRITATAELERSLTTSFSGSGVSTTCFMLSFTTTAGYNALAVGTDSAGSYSWKLLAHTTNGKFILQHGTTQSAATSTTYSTGTTYYVWIEYAKGTGSDGEMRLYVSTDTTKGSAVLTVANGNGTRDHDRLAIGDSTATTTQEFIVDHVRVIESDTSVTTWPE